MTFYCRVHPDFEGLDMGKLHDHVEKDHPEIHVGRGYKEAFAVFFRENIEIADYRRSDGKMVSRSWGRPPKLGNYMGDNQKEK